jgi:hypothetical protein
MAEGLSIESLSKGEPAQLIGAEEPRILITGLHGDETLAARLAYHLHVETPEYLAYVDYVCGNPDAAALGLRHVGHDLNRAFGQVPAGAGESEIQARGRARNILELIGRRGYDYVLDMHTSDTETEGFFLISRRNPTVDTIIGASVLEHVAVMPPTMIQNTLMGAVSQAVAIEYARTDEGRDVDESIDLIERLLSGATGTTPQERQFFNVARAISKDKDPGDAPNFELCADGYYPILLGKAGDAHSYRNSPGELLCYAADSIERVVL